MKIGRSRLTIIFLLIHTEYYKDGLFFQQLTRGTLHI
jgi:hypothetical protein